MYTDDIAMEELDYEPDAQYVRGFNDAYLLAGYDPNLLADITPDANPKDSYFDGFFDGKSDWHMMEAIKEAEKEAEQEIERLNLIRHAAMDRDKDQERNR